MRRRSGAYVIIYTMFALAALLALASLAVDYGRVELAKMELSRLADASARAAASEMSNGISSARQAAKSVALLNPVDENALSLVDSDITFGTWDAQTKAFTPVADGNFASANAVRVTATRSAAKNAAVPLLFGQLVGKSEIDVAYASVASCGGTSNSATATVTGKANVWFAGLPSTATCAKGGSVDTATNCPAVQFTGFNVTSGASLQFSATGTLSNVPSGGNTPDGGGSSGNNQTNNLGGKSNATLPINALVGVFLSDDDPTATAAPPDLNFSTTNSRNYTSLSPQLKQVFFIGDGKTSTQQQQTVVVPAGATRLFLGSFDTYGWSNNSGTCTVTVNSVGGSISVVK